MGRKKRSANNNVKRERFAVKELARLRKCLGIVDETGKDILDKVSGISTITDAKSIKKKAQKEEEEKQLLLDADMAESDDDDQEEAGDGKKVQPLVVKNDKTGVTHIHDPKTKRDQFGNYPIWHNRNAEKKKKRVRSRLNPKRSKKRMSLFNVSNPKDYK